MLAVRHVAGPLPRAQHREEPGRGGPIDGVGGPRVRHQAVVGAVEQESGGVARVDGPARQLGARDRLDGAHGGREALVLARTGVLGAVADVEGGDRPRGRAADGDAVGVDAVGRRLRPQEAHRRLRILAGVTDGGDAPSEVGARCAPVLHQAVVDRHGDVALAGERVGLLHELRRCLRPAAEAAAVHPHDRRAGGDRVAGRLVQVESQRRRLTVLVHGAAVGDVRRPGDRGEQVVAVAQRRLAAGRRQRVAPDQNEREQRDRGTRQQPVARHPATTHPMTPSCGHPCPCARLDCNLAATHDGMRDGRLAAPRVARQGRMPVVPGSGSSTQVRPGVRRIGAPAASRYCVGALAAGLTQRAV